MSQPILYLDRSTIRPGMETELRESIPSLVAFVEAQQPQVLLYGISIDEASHAMVVSAVHPDSASLERHLSIGGDEFRKVGRFIDLRSIEVSGRSAPVPSSSSSRRPRRSARTRPSESAR